MLLAECTFPRLFLFSRNFLKVREKKNFSNELYRGKQGEHADNDFIRTTYLTRAHFLCFCFVSFCTFDCFSFSLESDVRTQTNTRREAHLHSIHTYKRTYAHTAYVASCAYAITLKSQRSRVYFHGYTTPDRTLDILILSGHFNYSTRARRETREKLFSEERFIE